MLRAFAQSCVKPLQELRFPCSILGEWDSDSPWFGSCFPFFLLWLSFCLSALFLLEFCLCFVHIYTTQGLRDTWWPRKISHSLLHPRLFHTLCFSVWRLLPVTGSCLQSYHLEVPSHLCLLRSFLHGVHLCEERLLWQPMCAWMCSLHGKGVESRGKGMRRSKLWMESLEHLSAIEQQQIKNWLLTAELPCAVKWLDKANIQ